MSSSKRALAIVALFSFGAVAAGTASGRSAPQFVAGVNNPFFPLLPGMTYVYEGKKGNTPTRDEVTVTHDTRVIDGVTTMVVHDAAFEDDVLAEDTLDYYAQDRDGNVWYFGEDTKELDPSGNVVSTEGSWLAGVNGARPGIIMEAHPAVGDRYAQENAPGVAQDMAEVLSLDATPDIPFGGKFPNCLETEETSPLEPGVVEHKFYAPEIGLLEERVVKGGRETSALVRIDREPVAVDPANFTTTIDNPYLPLVPGRTNHYAGEEDGRPTTNDVTVTHDTKVIDGVTVVVVHDQVFTEGVLSEDTLDYFAQDLAGNVWYFGEDTEELDKQGRVLTTFGSWHAGVGGGIPGIAMEAHPTVGDRYFQEFGPEIAEDMARILDVNASLCVPYDCFDHVLVTKEWSLLEPGIFDQKEYARGIGMIRERTVIGGDEVSSLVGVTTQ